MHLTRTFLQQNFHKDYLQQIYYMLNLKHIANRCWVSWIMFLILGNKINVAKCLQITRRLYCINGHSLAKIKFVQDKCRWLLYTVEKGYHRLWWNNQLGKARQDICLFYRMKPSRCVCFLFLCNQSFYEPLPKCRM